MIAVPFFFLRVTDLTVILLDGAAAGRHGSVGPETRLGFDDPPLKFARPTKSVAPSFPQKTYWELTATPQGVFAAEVALGMNTLLGMPPPRGARPIAWML